WSIGANRIGVGELRVYVVPDVEEFSAELESPGLRDHKILEQRYIPGLESRALNDVAPSVPKRSNDCVGGERAGIENGAGDTGRGIGVAHAIGAGAVGDCAPAIGSRNGIAGDVGGGEPVSCRCGYD